MSEDNQNDEKYKGPGKFVAGLGRGSVEATVGAVGGVVVGAAVGAVFKKPMTGMSWGAVTGAAGGLGHGIYAGVSSVTAAKDQLDATQKENHDLKTENKFRKMVEEKRVEIPGQGIGGGIGGKF